MTPDWKRSPALDTHRQALRGHDVVGVLRSHIPFVSEAATIEIATARPLSVLEEFTMRAFIEIDDLRSAADVSDLLGLGQPAFVEPFVNQLGQVGLLQGLDGGPLTAAPALHDLYERRTWEDITRTSCAAFFCPLTGARHAEVVGLIEVTDSSEPLDAPDPDAFATWAVSDAGPHPNVARDRVRSVTFDRRTAGLGLRCDVVIYTDDEDGTWWWEPYLPDTARIAVEMRDACRTLGADQAALDFVRALDGENTELPPEPPAGSAVRGRIATLNASNSLAVKRYGTDGARQAIAARIASAKDEVIASFPWIKSGALSDDLLKAIKKALSRGASVYIAYGIASREADEDSHADAIAQLRALHASNTGEVVHVAWVGNSHAKEILVDGVHYLGGSYNRFSFRGDPDRSGVVRRESMIYTNDESVVEDTRNAIVPDLQAALVRDASQAPLPDDVASWISRWRPILKLDWNPGAIRAALSGAPASARERSNVLLRLIALFRKADLVPAVLEAFAKAVPPDFLRAADPPEAPATAPAALQKAVAALEKATGADLSQLQAAIRHPDGNAAP